MTHTQAKYRSEAAQTEDAAIQAILVVFMVSTMAQLALQVYLVMHRGF